MIAREGVSTSVEDLGLSSAGTSCTIRTHDNRVGAYCVTATLKMHAVLHTLPCYAVRNKRCYVTWIEM